MKEATPSQGKRRWWRSAMLGAILLSALYVLLPLALNALAARLVRQDSLQPADVVIVLGGGIPCQRPQYGAELYRRGLARKLVIGGVPNFWGANAQIEVRRSLVNVGVAEADIVIPNDTPNTRQEADGLAALMRERGWQSALLVTDPFHTRRAHYTLQRIAPELRFYAAPVPAGPDVWQSQRWWTRRSDMFLTIRELIAWINTLAGGLR